MYVGLYDSAVGLAAIDGQYAFSVHCTQCIIIYSELLINVCFVYRNVLRYFGILHVQLRHKIL